MASAKLPTGNMCGLGSSAFSELRVRFGQVWTGFDRSWAQLFRSGSTVGAGTCWIPPKSDPARVDLGLGWPNAGPMCLCARPSCMAHRSSAFAQSLCFVYSTPLRICATRATRTFQRRGTAWADLCETERPSEQVIMRCVGAPADIGARIPDMASFGWVAPCLLFRAHTVGDRVCVGRSVVLASPLHRF